MGQEIWLSSRTRRRKVFILNNSLNTYNKLAYIYLGDMQQDSDLHHATQFSSTVFVTVTVGGTRSSSEGDDGILLLPILHCFCKDRCRRHRNDPTWVVGEHKQFFALGVDASGGLEVVTLSGSVCWTWLLDSNGIAIGGSSLPFEEHEFIAVDSIPGPALLQQGMLS